ncbi:MAG: phage tail spike protein [Sarcina sp.]
MKIILFDKNTKKGQFINFGYGKLTKVLKCEVFEELNGRYDAELLISMNDSKQKLIKKWSIIYIDGQLFRVVKRTDIDKDNTIKIFTKHIFYDINSGFIIDNKADNKTMLEAMKIAIPSDFKGVFDVDSDITDINSLYFVKNNGAENIFGIIDRWGKGELTRDNFNIKINKAKGSDKGVTFTYQKIDAIEIDEDTENVVTRLYPTGKDGITLEEHYVTIPNWNEEDYPPFHITKEIKFEGAESTGELRVLAKKEAEKIGLARTNFKINVHDLSNTHLSKYIPVLSNVDVGDIVTIKHKKLNVRVKVKCIKKVHEKVTNKLTLEFGQPMENFFDAVDNSNNQVTIPDTTKYEDHMFFYFNDSEVIFNKESNDVCYLRYGVGEETNLMLYFNIFCEVKENCKVNIKLKIDNEILNFQPQITLEKGFRNISFTYPLIRTKGGVAHTLNPILELSQNASLFVPAENIQIIIKGQNISMAMKAPPGADVIETLNLSPTNLEDLITKDSNLIEISGPKREITSDFWSLSKTNFKTLINEARAEVLIKSNGRIFEANELEFEYDKDKVDIINNEFKLNCLKEPFGSYIKMRVDANISMNYLDYVRQIVINANVGADGDVLKFLISVDKGISWVSRYENSWVHVTLDDELVIRKGMELDVINSLSEELLKDLTINSDNIRICFFMDTKDSNSNLNVSKIEFKYKLKEEKI